MDVKALLTLISQNIYIKAIRTLHSSCLKYFISCRNNYNVLTRMWIRGEKTKCKTNAVNDDPLSQCYCTFE